MLVTVIIPTYNDWGRLSKCLDSLKTQTLAQKKFEIIIANNDPTSTPPASLVLPTNCTLINVAKPGSYSARNKAIELAKGEVLAFTDSDCIPDENWLSNAVFTIQDTGIDRIGGKVEIFREPHGTKNSFIYEKYMVFKQEKNVADGHSITANLIVKRATIDKVGFFNEELLSGGDTEWNLRATKQNASLLYSENCVVRHPARLSINEILTKSKRVAGGMYKRGDNTIQYILKSPLPPRGSLVQSLQQNATIKEALIVFYIAYLRKLTLAVTLIKLHLGLEREQRQ